MNAILFEENTHVGLAYSKSESQEYLSCESEEGESNGEPPIQLRLWQLKYSKGQRRSERDEGAQEAKGSCDNAGRDFLQESKDYENEGTKDHRTNGHPWEWKQSN